VPWPSLDGGTEHVPRTLAVHVSVPSIVHGPRSEGEMYSTADGPEAIEQYPPGSWKARS
jgi:hypothetical protein